MDRKENPAICPIYAEIAESFHLKAPVCPNAVIKNEDGEVISICPKKTEDCLTVANLEADVAASRVPETDLELEQDKLIRKWLEDSGISPSSLA